MQIWKRPKPSTGFIKFPAFIYLAIFHSSEMAQFRRKPAELIVTKCIQFPNLFKQGLIFLHCSLIISFCTHLCNCSYFCLAAWWETVNSFMVTCFFISTLFGLHQIALCFGLIPNGSTLSLLPELLIGLSQKCCPFGHFLIESWWYCWLSAQALLISVTPYCCSWILRHFPENCHLVSVVSGLCHIFLIL